MAEISHEPFLVGFPVHFAKSGDADKLFAFSELGSKSDMQLQKSFFKLVDSTKHPKVLLSV